MTTLTMSMKCIVLIMTIMQAVGLKRNMYIRFITVVIARGIDMFRAFASLILAMLFLFGVVRFSSIILATLTLLCASACERYLDKEYIKYHECKRRSK